MRWSEAFIPTLKENPSSAETPSHSLLLRGGFIRPLASGVYSYLPLGWRVLKRIEAIIREEMDRIGAQELSLPIVGSREVWEESGRWVEWGDVLFRLKDRRGRELCLNPTHEEIVTDLIRQEIRSYRDLPQIWYQIQLKFRDEPRPRGGVLRVREFMMKDSYSMDMDEAGLGRSYELHREAYSRVFKRCGLNFFMVSASSGVMGGGGSEEFMAPAPFGEDIAVLCQACRYAANLEVAQSSAARVDFPPEPLKKVHTPVAGTVEAISGFLGCPKGRLMKSLLYISGGEPIFLLVRGDHELSEPKLLLHFGPSIRSARPEEIEELIGAKAGYVGPVGVKGVRVYADEALRGAVGLVTGANENDYHHTGVSLDRDVEVSGFRDLRQAMEGDRCGRCGGELGIFKTIELGHIFKLGTRYSETMGATFLDGDGKKRPVIMGSYGIGLERIMAAAIEQNHDGNGISWPQSIAPYDLLVLPVNMGHAQSAEMGERLYRDLSGKGYEVLLDDRDMSAGVKFKDGDLIGIPVRVTVGERSLSEGKVEIAVRRTGGVFKLPPDGVLEKVDSLLKQVEK